MLIESDELKAWLKKEVINFEEGGDQFEDYLEQANDTLNKIAELEQKQKCSCKNGMIWLGTQEQYEHMQTCSDPEFILTYVSKGRWFEPCIQCRRNGAKA